MQAIGEQYYVLAPDTPGFGASDKISSFSGPTLLSDELKAILPSKAESFKLTTQGGHLQRMWQRIRGKDPLADLSLSMRETLLAFQCGDDYKTAYQGYGRTGF